MAIPQNGNFFSPAIEAITQPQASAVGPSSYAPQRNISRPPSCQQPDFLAHVISAAQLNLTPGPTLNHLVDIPGDAIYVAGPRNGMAFPLMIHFKTIDAMTVKDDNGQIIFNRCPGLKVFLNNATDWRLYKFCCGFERFYVSWIQQSQVFDGDLVIHVFPKGVVEMFAGTTG